MTQFPTTVRARTEAAFDVAFAAMGDDPATAHARAVLTAHRERFRTPIRVALVGRVSAGKSTLINALVGSHRAATGIEELTFNVNWLRHGTDPHIRIHFRDGREPERCAVSDLFRLSVRSRSDSHSSVLAQIDYLETFDPSPALRVFDLVDTPGLDTVLGEDATNTLRFLALEAGDVRAASMAHASRADALVLVFAAAVHAREAELLADFTGAGFGGSGPVTTVGALTKVEHFWPRSPDPLAEGRRVADFLMTRSGARRLLYDLVPVASLVAEGAALFTADEFVDLVALSAVEPRRLAQLASRRPYFATREYDDVPVPAARRSRLLRRFESYGVVLSCELIRDGLDCPDDLRATLLDRSGLTGFRRMLVGHFGNRADLVKLDRVIQDLKRAAPALTRSLAPREADDVRAAVNAVTRLERREHEFAELDVLRDHYGGRITLRAPEVADLLRVTGEYGHRVSDRLGLSETAHTDDAQRVARSRLSRWAHIAEDPLNDRPTRTAARVIRRSYDFLLAELGERRDL